MLHVNRFRRRFFKTANYNLLILIGLVISQVSCKPKNDIEPTNRIDVTFQEYYDAFLREATSRNVKTATGFTMQFGKLTSGYGGATYPEKGLIVIDSTEWRNGSEEYHEYIIFHELGHLLLNRSHTAKRLANGEIGSIMYGLDTQPTVYDPSPIPIFRGIRKKYYLDELFDPKAKEPEFTQGNYSPFATKPRKLIGRLALTDRSEPVRTYVSSLTNCSCVLSKDNLLVQLPKGYGFGLTVSELLKLSGMSQQDIATKLLLPDYEIAVSYKTVSQGIAFNYYNTRDPYTSTIYNLVQDTGQGLSMDVFGNVAPGKLMLTAKPTDGFTTLKLVKQNGFFGLYLNETNLFYGEALPDGSPFQFVIAGKGEGAVFYLDYVSFSEL